MNKSYMAILAVVALILVGLLLSRFSNSAPTNTLNDQQAVNTPTVSQDDSVPSGSITISPTDSQNENTAMIEYTANGFMPSTVTVKKGDTVQWVNKTDQSMWVASAPHPQHTDYPGFDQLKGVGNGESYMFTFDKTGTWKFHNHLNPKDFGKVIIE